MTRLIKSTLAFVLTFMLIAPLVAADAGRVYAEDALPFDLDCISAVLMDSETGTVLYSKNGDEALPPASVTKVMTLLLVMEAIDAGKLSLNDTLQVSENAASMGGSQVFLEAGEQMSVEDLIKSVVISSANDAAVTLAEAVAGSETGFIAMMNERASSLGLRNTNFENATGLDDTTVNHVTSAHDVAVMSRELISHPLILKYSSIWMDTIRNGAFGLTNTNRLVRFYNGATGLKTGSTSRAKFCISATAKRGDLHLIAVIMGAPTRDIRNEAAKLLLDYGFANFTIFRSGDEGVQRIKVLGGVSPSLNVGHEPFSALIPKGDLSNIMSKVEIPDSVKAPVKRGDVLGKVTYYSGDEILGGVDITASEDDEKLGFFGLFARMLRTFSLS